MGCVYSQVSKAVDAWQGDLKSKDRPKVAASIAHPGTNPELFEEGWEQALAKESGMFHFSVCEV